MEQYACMRLASPLKVCIIWRECTNFATGTEGVYITTNVYLQLCLFNGLPYLL